MDQNPKKLHFTLQVFYGGPTFFGRRFLFHNKSRRYKLDNFFLLVIFFKFFSLKLSDSSRFLIKNDLGPLSHFDTCDFDKKLDHHKILCKFVGTFGSS